MFEVKFYEDPQVFGDLVQPVLLESEAENCLLLSLLPALVKGAYGEFWMAAVEEEGRVVSCVAQTPPFDMLLPRMPEAALTHLVDALLARFPALEGVSGSVEMVEAFCVQWHQRTGAEVVLQMPQGLFELSRVQFPDNPAPGAMRMIREEDFPLLAQWLDGFDADTGMSMGADKERVLQARLARGSLLVWEDDGILVSMAGWSGETPHGVRVNAVYTPPEQRGKGYASVLVAQVSQQLLDTGRQKCFLYTDLRNPISNRLYMRLGYRHVCDGRSMGFRYGAGRITP